MTSFPATALPNGNRVWQRRLTERHNLKVARVVEMSTSRAQGNADLEEQMEDLSHEEIMEISQSALKRIMATDSLLSDLPGDVTVDEVQSQIAVAHGQSITVTLLRNLETPLPVVVSGLMGLRCVR